jgi:uncharacterized protein (TIGR02271 family)
MSDASSREDAARDEGASIVRHEEELDVRTDVRDRGAVRAAKRVEHEDVHEVVPRAIEHFDEVERTGANEADSGEVEVLPDGSISIPILEEELVIEKRTVVRERVIVRKRTETRHEEIDAVLRKERIDVEVDDPAA